MKKLKYLYMMNEDIFVIPKDNESLDADIKSRKSNYMNHILETFESIDFIKNAPEKITLFRFKNTNLEVVVKSESYIANLQNLLDYYIELEEYESCASIKDIINKIENMNNKDGEAEQD